MRGSDLATQMKLLAPVQRRPAPQADPVGSRLADAPAAAQATTTTPVQRRAIQRSGTGPTVNPPASRHDAWKVNQGTVAKDKNTVIDRGTNVAGDVAAIRAGRATEGRTAGGEKSYTVNGRTYGAHANGTLYPVSGPGFTDLTRIQFKALGAMNALSADPRLPSILRSMGVSASDEAIARAVHDRNK